jgi:D-alanyl-D-alanine carboxypeptidase (penicillin-binding protein 5/6)
LRRSEVILLVLFLATALVYIVTRPKDAPTGPAPVEAAAHPNAFQATAAPSGASNGASGAATALPKPTPTPIPRYFSSAWLDAHPATDVPAITAQGAIVVDRDTQQIMYAKNIDQRRPPASIMKLMTAMVALDSAPPTQMLTVTPAAAAMEPNRMGLDAGEQLTVEEVMYGMLLDSGNDAAEALADALGGHDAFIQKMNAKAADLGLENTHFVDAAGLDDNDYTSPYDMAVLADAAYTGYPTIRQIVGTKQQTIVGTATHKWFQPINLNDLLWDYPGTYGMKVGYTDAAQYTIVLAGQKDGHNVEIVLLGSQHHFTEGRALFDWAYAHLPAADDIPVKKFAADIERRPSP